MEEDIKTIQEKLKIIQSLCTDDCINKSTVIQPLIYAIQNLIARYKELELNDKEKQVVEAYRNLVKITGKDTGWVVCDPKQMWSDYFIPKSKVKEKIQKYNEIIYYAQTEEGMAELKDFEYEEAKYGIQILAELIED